MSCPLLFYLIGKKRRRKKNRVPVTVARTVLTLRPPTSLNRTQAKRRRWRRRGNRGNHHQRPRSSYEPLCSTTPVKTALRASARSSRNGQEGSFPALRKVLCPKTAADGCFSAASSPVPSLAKPALAWDVTSRPSTRTSVTSARAAPSRSLTATPLSTTLRPCTTRRRTSACNAAAPCVGGWWPGTSRPGTGRPRCPTAALFATRPSATSPPSRPTSTSSTSRSATTSAPSARSRTSTRTRCWSTPARAARQRPTCARSAGPTSTRRRPWRTTCWPSTATCSTRAPAAARPTSGGRPTSGTSGSAARTRKKRRKAVTLRLRTPEDRPAELTITICFIHPSGMNTL